MKSARVLLSTLLLSALATASYAATGFEYIPDAATLGLWHFNEAKGNSVQDESKNRIKSVIEGVAKGDTNEEWNGLSSKGHSLFLFMRRGIFYSEGVLLKRLRSCWTAFRT
jgi:hypothetical protein